MSNYFVRHYDDTSATTPAATADSAVNTTPKELSNDLHKYFNNNAIHDTHNTSPTNSKVFTSDGLTFRRIAEGDKAEVVGLAAASSAFALVVPPVTSFLSLPVVKIGDDAFKNASRLRTITLPSSVEEIGNYAFAGSTIETITLLPSVKVLGKGAFEGCTNLHSVNLNATEIKAIEDKTFMNCPALKNVFLPDAVGRLGNSCFENCFSLESVSLPNDLFTIGERAFYNCKSMQSITFGAGISDVGKEAFGNCLSLSTVIDPCRFVKDNVHILRDTALYRNAEYNSCGVKCILNTVLDTREPVFKFYQQMLPGDAEIIASYAFLNCTADKIVLPKSIRLLMPNALVQRGTTKSIVDGVVRTGDTLTVKAHIIFQGSVLEWSRVTKLKAAEIYPVCVTCEGEKTPSTFIDYI